MPADKPFYRPRNLILATLAILAVIVSYQVYLALTARPGRTIDYAAKMAELIESNQPTDAGPDAWPVLRDIIERQTTVESDLRAVSPGPVLDYSALYVPHLKPIYDDNYSWDQAESLALRGLDAMKAAGIFDSLKQLKDMRRAIRPTPRAPLIEILLPELGHARQLARMNGARMRKALRGHDEPEFAEAYEETLALGRMMCLQGTFIEHLVGIAIVALADNQVRDAMTEHPLSAPGCESLLAAMDRQLPLTPISAALEGERLSTLDIIQWTHTDDGHGSGRLILSSLSQLGGSFGGAGTGPLPSWRIFNLGAIAFPSKAANIAKANEFYDQCRTYLAMSTRQRRASAFKPDVWGEEPLPQRSVVLRMVTPAMGKCIASRTQCEMDIAGTRLQIAIELFNARNHRYPSTLDELVPSILPAIPADPYPAERFVYRLITPDQDSIRRADGSARPYLLYSCGADGIDNDGKPSRPNSYTALTGAPPGHGFDFVLNQPLDRPTPEDASPADPTPAPSAAPDAPPVEPPKPAGP